MNSTKISRYGQIVYNSNDTIIGKQLNQYGEYAENQARLFKSLIKEGDWVLELGANFGTHTLLFSHLVKNGVVFAFEPNRISFNCLCGTIALNNIENVYCQQQYFTGSDGHISIAERDQNVPQDFCKVEEAYPGTNSCTVRTRCLGIFNTKQCNFIKIASGKFQDIIDGGLGLIDTHRPFIYVATNEKKYDVSKLKELGYTIYVHTPRLFCDTNFAENQFNTLGNTAEQNLLCSPSPIDYDVDLDVFEGNEFVPVPLSRTEQLQYAQEKMKTAAINLAAIYSGCFNDHKKAEKCLEPVAEMCPDEVVLNGLAGAYSRQKRWGMAESVLEEALEIYAPKNSNLWIEHGIMLDSQRKYKEALISYDKSLAIRKSAKAIWYKALTLLTLGRYDEGWPLYETRLSKPEAQQWIKSLKKFPYWDGSSLKEKKILLFNEQGLGDLIQMVRYIPLLKAQGAYVAYAGWEDACALVGSIGIDEKIIYKDSWGGEVDYIASVFSLPYLLKTTVETIPSECPYIPITTGGFYSSVEGVRVGIVWAGSPTHENDCLRSCHLKEMQPLEGKNRHLFDLQKGPQKRIWTNCGQVDLLEGSNVKLLDMQDRLKTINSTANVISSLDCVVCVDTAVAHLAGALGKPTYLALGFGSDFRWGTENRTPWYPTMKIFRQTDPENWREVFQRISDTIEIDSIKWKRENK